MPLHWTRMIAAAAVAVGAVACSSGESSGPHGDAQPPASALYGPAIKRVVFEIDYVPGAEPYTGTIAGFGDIWGLFDTNVRRLFEGSEKQIELPTTLDAMEKLDGVSGATFSGEAILELAKAHRDRKSSGDTATFYFVWLDGHYDDGTKVRDDVLGVSLGDTGVIAMFMPVIAASGGPLPGLGVEKYVEQATAIHELGHAAGLVDNGIPMAAPHQDEEHGAHCTNQDCVMFFAVEGTNGAIDFVKKAVITNDVTLWGSECLADAAAAAK